MARRSDAAQQIEACLRRILATDHPFVLYTEPDKGCFFESGARQFLHAARDRDNTVVCVAGRDEQSFLTFPEGQQASERAFNVSPAGYLDYPAIFSTALLC